MKVCYFFLICFYFHLSEENSLVLVQVLFRHGDRTPTETYPKDPYQNWKEGWGHLTSVGKMQLFVLGKLLRERYRQFLPSYYIAENVDVTSSYADRCIMSAQTLLAGLFPPEREQVWNPSLLWQPIPVKYKSRSEDRIIAMKEDCPAYNSALKAAYNSPRIQQINKDNADLYEFLTEVTGSPMKDINAVEYLYNTLEIELQNNLTLPQWTKNVSLPHLKEIAKLNYAIFTDTVLMKRLTGGSFLTEVVSHIKKKINQTTNLDVALYSGHDITLVTVLRTLGFEELLKPEYGAYLIFELHKTALNYYELKFFYGPNFKTSPHEIELKLCPSPCKFEDFLYVMEPVLPIDWEAECLKVNF